MLAPASGPELVDQPGRTGGALDGLSLGEQFRSQTVSSSVKRIGAAGELAARLTLLDCALSRAPWWWRLLLAAATAQTWSRCDPDQACGRRRLRRVRSVIPFGVLAAVPVASCVPATGPAVEVASWGRR